jgi:hypothetical protein
MPADRMMLPARKGRKPSSCNAPLADDLLMIVARGEKENLGSLAA